MPPTDTRSRLIETAGDLFYRQGFQAVGLDQVLDRVGITKTAFYKHFESKDDLIVAVLEKRDGDDMKELLRVMEEQGGADPRARLLAMFDLLDAWFRDPEFRGCLFMNAATEFPSPNDPIHRAAAAHSIHMGREVQRCLQAIGVADPDGLTRQSMLLISGSIAARHVGGDMEAALAARSAVEALLDRDPAAVRG